MTAGQCPVRPVAMPPRRGYKKKYSGYRKGKYSGQHGGYSYRRNIAGQATSSISVEKKYLDGLISENAAVSHAVGTTWTEVGMSATAANFTPFQMVPGTGESDRIGRSVWVHSLTLRLKLDVGSHNSHIAAQVCRFAIVLDKDANNAIPAAANIWTFPTTHHSNRVLNNIQRYKVLKYIDIPLGRPHLVWDGTVARSGNLIIQKEIFLNFKVPLRIDFEGSAGTHASLTRTSITLFSIKEVANPTITVDPNQSLWRVRFSDSPGVSRYVHRRVPDPP